MKIGTYNQVGFDKGKYKYQCEICGKAFFISHEKLSDKKVQEQLKAQCDHIEAKESANQTFNEAVSKVLDSGQQIETAMVKKPGRKKQAK